MICWKCGEEILLEGKPGRQDTCHKCNSYLHCCYNCRFYDKTAYNECHESEAEFVPDKEMGNFCDYFTPSKGKKKTEEKKISKEDADKRLKELFRRHSKS